MQCWLIVHSVYECTVSIYAQFIYIVVCYLINIYHSLVPLSSVSLNKLAPCMHDTISTIYTAPNKSTPVKHVSVCVISHNFTLLSLAIAVNALSLSLPLRTALHVSSFPCATYHSCRSLNKCGALEKSDERVTKSVNGKPLTLTRELLLWEIAMCTLSTH